MTDAKIAKCQHAAPKVNNEINNKLPPKSCEQHQIKIQNNTHVNNHLAWCQYTCKQQPGMASKKKQQKKQVQYS